MSLEIARTNMVSQQLRTWGVTDQQVLDLFEQVPREFFVAPHYQHLAFADVAVPLGHGQEMLIPRQEAKILGALALQKNQRVLEIGTGSGYFTALLANQSKHVESVDIFEDFTQQAAQKLTALNIHNVMLQTADAAAGYKKNIQYDVIVITGSLPFLPKAFLHQVSVGGKVFVYVGEAPVMQATLITRSSQNDWQTDILYEAYVNPLINALKPSGFHF